MEFSLPGLIVVFVLVAFLLFGEIIPSLSDSMNHKKKVKKANQEWIKVHGVQTRRRCVNCKYCKTSVYKPFYHSYALAMRVPRYCRKFCKKLNATKENQRCIAEYLEKAEFED